MVKLGVGKVAVTIGLVLMCGVVGIAIRGCTLFFPQITVSSLSPDDKWRVMLAERRLDIDRNFIVQVEEVQTRRVRTVFRSPDEGRPIGSERIVWSEDGTRFLVLGRHFYRCDAVRLATGEQPYLLVDLASGKVWCNAGQQEALPKFGMAELGKTKWVGWSLE